MLRIYAQPGRFSRIKLTDEVAIGFKGMRWGDLLRKTARKRSTAEEWVCCQLALRLEKRGISSAAALFLYAPNQLGYLQVARDFLLTGRSQLASSMAGL